MKNKFLDQAIGKDRPKIQTREHVLRMIAEYVHSAEQEDIYVGSCHAAVAWWIAHQDELIESDEIVLLGRSGEKERVFHSVIMRGDNILGDTEKAARNMPVEYNSETGIYTTLHNKNTAEKVSFETLQRMSLRDFKAQYVEPLKSEPALFEELKT